jgi:hypothetical protein
MDLSQWLGSVSMSAISLVASMSEVFPKAIVLTTKQTEAIRSIVRRAFLL